MPKSRRVRVRVRVAGENEAGSGGFAGKTGGLKFNSDDGKLANFLTPSSLPPPPPFPPLFLSLAVLNVGGLLLPLFHPSSCAAAS